jgi:hypothetical protein
VQFGDPWIAGREDEKALDQGSAQGGHGLLKDRVEKLLLRGARALLKLQAVH